MRVSRSLLPILGIVVAIAMGATLIGLGVRDGGGIGELAALSSGGNPGPVTPTSAAPPTPDPEELARQERERNKKALDKALKEYAETVPEFSVAVLDAETGDKYAYRGSKRYETASVVKVQVMTCLLLTAQDDDRKLTSSELSRAKLMIRISDNNATTSLYQQLGGRTAITDCNKRLGLKSTVVKSSWGLTQTTVDDQMRLLTELVDDESPLNAKSRKIAFELMNEVDKGQQWGISAAAKKGEDFTIKNGWLPRSTENQRWIINSVGRISDDGIDVSIAVLSHGHATELAGRKVVQTVAKMTRKYLKY
ncbi:serine hydrolase [Actinoplanes sp. G11-F43]|uniref:serine hydrolase n=1 Tax=Actinoplanes sp. G11-F43 TaxID=3424130 RepID=UPI003D335162